MERQPTESFAQIFARVVQDAAPHRRRLEPGECQSPAGEPCRLCAASTLDYDPEAAIKNRALQIFWKPMPVPLGPLVPSPAGRAYRTVTKRKVIPVRGIPRLGLIDPSDEGPVRPFEVARCAIEPLEHEVLYRRAAQEIRTPAAAPLAGVLRYMIVKGSYKEFTVILNLSAISPQATKAAVGLSKALSRTGIDVTGVFLFEERADSGYYLGSTHSGGRQRTRKIFGKSEIFHQVSGRSFLFSPFTFSQVNHSLLEKLVDKAGELLAFPPDARLIDLYCGYGLFSLSLAGAVKGVTGLELSADAVAAAQRNARRQHVRNARFFQVDITGATLPRALPYFGRSDVVLLDPPRGGTAPGVIEWIASRQPLRILHLFCNIDILPTELARWKAGGYRPATAIPFDMFPGTPVVEIMVLLEREATPQAARARQESSSSPAQAGTSVPPRRGGSPERSSD